MFLISTACFLALATSVFASPAPSARLSRQSKRSIVTSPDALDGKTFDFVIAGGGAAGLALAARLSEWSNISVALIEAGGTGDEQDATQDSINIPGYSYLNGLGGSDYDWKYTTVGQSNAGGTTRSWPRGKVLGGSTSTNGLFYCRGHAEEYDAWDALNPGGNVSWGWTAMSTYMDKAETYHPPTADQIASTGLKPDASAHGSTGPIQLGFSAFMYEGVNHWIPSWESLGFSSIDGASGSNHGVTITPSTINPLNMSRSDAKAGFLDPLPPRSNLVILSGYQVVSVQFNSTIEPLIASGVRFQASRGGKVYTVNADKEVVLSGGTIGSPQILQLSGIGPSSTLKAAGVEVLLDLPVGHNLQDHSSTTMYWSTPAGEVTWGTLRDNKDLQASALASYRAGNYPESQWTYVNEAIGYVSLADIMTDHVRYAQNVSDYSELIVDNIAAVDGLSAGQKKGLMAQYEASNKFLSSDVGQAELLLTMLGPGTQVGIQVAFQHPYSRGTVLIKSSDAFDYPLIDPAYFKSNIDVEITLAAELWARKLAGAGPNAEFMITETSATAGKTGEELIEWFKASAATEYHPLGTNSMLPRDSGGVVDTTLLVYGTSNLRVVDASIMPLQVSAHLMAPTYGIAEHAADIIKARYAFVPPPPAVVSPSSTSLAATQTISSSAIASSANAGLINANIATDGGLSTGAKGGIAGGVVAGVLALGFVAGLLFWRRKKAAAEPTEKGWYSEEGAADSASHPLDTLSPSGSFVGASGGGYAAVAAPQAAFAHTLNNRDSFNTLEMSSAEPLSTQDRPLYQDGPHPPSRQY